MYTPDNNYKQKLDRIEEELALIKARMAAREVAMDAIDANIQALKAKLSNR